MPEDAIGTAAKENIVKEAPGDLFDAPDNAVLIRMPFLLRLTRVDCLGICFQMHVTVPAPGALVSRSSLRPR